MSAPEPAVLQALQGYTQQSDKWPGPRAVKIFVASVFNVLQVPRGYTQQSDKWPGPRAVKIFVASVFNVLQVPRGYTQQSDKWPGPRAVKIFVASVFNATRSTVLQVPRGYTQQSDKWPGPRAVKIFVASVFNVLQVLHGYTQQSDNWPGPRAVKIFVASVFNDFREERRHILELVGPELQSTYDDRHIEIEFVDMHYGTDGGDETNPSLLRYHLEEIRCCNQSVSSVGMCHHTSQSYRSRYQQTPSRNYSRRSLRSQTSSTRVTGFKTTAAST
ncbi:Uncharacterized protein OBRU01_20742 [Operophtera brumata]|uniref:Uncharacterized protein n=1 Tax=Operophtera brumata TaxID=104452 RepID=A0A0L7KUR0_OPEBR|nr:Uncharacterized protein OBRU01_20742 [Operophtera brumata]